MTNLKRPMFPNADFTPNYVTAHNLACLVDRLDLIMILIVGDEARGNGETMEQVVEKMLHLRNAVVEEEE